MQHAIDFLKRGLRIAQNRRCNCQLFEYSLLRVELAHLVMEQWIFFTFAHARRAADDHDRRFFSERFSRGVRNFQSADAIRDANRAQSTARAHKHRRQNRRLVRRRC